MMIKKYVVGGLAGLTGGTFTLSLFGLELKGNGLVLIGVLALILAGILWFWSMTLKSDRAERIIISLFGKKEDTKIGDETPEEEVLQEEEEPTS